MLEKQMFIQSFCHILSGVDVVIAVLSLRHIYWIASNSYLLHWKGNGSLKKKVFIDFLSGIIFFNLYF